MQRGIIFSPVAAAWQPGCLPHVMGNDPFLQDSVPALSFRR